MENNSHKLPPLPSGKVIPINPGELRYEKIPLIAEYHLITRSIKRVPS